ncbi:MAG: hypothetical protein CVV27_10915 [Candidatus Melainabacteria bacterium HGW-Melainabacteria-1]|nr:MAG: hypothetical protein CVV27_10915 [Candidatus Melainabacteria bacterium HGW-Melainabacteria-1]
MPSGPQAFFQGWSQLFGRSNGPFPHTRPEDLDHPHNPPKVGPELLSQQGTPSPKDADRPVVVTVHGFSATPFETHFLLKWLRERDFLGSQVMLGAHGEHIEAFRQASWRDWQAPLESELRALQKLGYRNQIVLSTSTGGTLMLDLLSRSYFPALRKLVMVAPIVEPYDRLMRVTPLARHSRIVPSILNSFDDEYIGCWYRELPLSAIVQLDRLTRRVRSQLRRGLKLPSQLQVLILQSRRDLVVDRRSAFAVADGLTQNHVEVLLLDSHWHLPILPREDPREEAIKDWVYARILDFLKTDYLPPDRYYGLD